MLYNEILSSKAHVVCMQEVDRLEKPLHVLEEASYSHAFKTFRTQWLIKDPP